MSVNKVPVEIWEEILERCFIADDWAIGSNLAQVNTKTRSKLLSTPIPWRRIYIKAVELLDHDSDIRESYEAWASLIKERSEHSVKYIHLDILYAPENKKYKLLHTYSLDNLLNPFTLLQLDTLIFTSGQPYVELFSIPAKHIIARHTGLDEDSDPIALHLNNTVETVDCEDVVLRYPDIYTGNVSTSLRSARSNFVGRTNAIMKSNQWTGDDFRDCATAYDDEHFDVIFSSPKLESLTVIHSDAATWTTSKSMAQLKSLTVSNSHCDFFYNVRMPNLERLTLADCFSIQSNDLAVMPDSIKHLAVIRTETPYYYHYLPNIISLNLEGSPLELVHWVDRLLNVQNHNLTSLNSLKALNISFTCVDFETVLEIAKRLDLDQLVCDMPPGEGLEGYIRDFVPHVWTSIEQYYEDVERNDDLEQYFFPAPVEPGIPPDSDEET
ncbi:hypothetical protein E3P96_01670 [Wallemia ichthyophaga]|nr:hypothetical protein E3P96_01670 [Wallemia ichthyophaga]